MSMRYPGGVISGTPPATLSGVWTLQQQMQKLSAGKWAIPPVNTVAPTVSGTAEVGQTLSSTTGTWTGNPTPTFAYQWQRATTNIGGATSSTYVLVTADVGSTIRCVVTATNQAGVASANSANTSPVIQPLQLWSWGNNTSGRLGLNNTANRSSPVQVGTLVNWAQVSAGKYSSAAVKEDGTLWTWGDGAQGKLGLGTTTNYSSPKQVGALTGWLQVSISTAAVFAIKTDGGLWAWGLNNFGQLGLDNTTYAYSSPVQVGALTTWASVCAFNDGGFAIKTDGTMWSWGNNGTYGKLAQGDTISRSSPTQVGADIDWAKVTITENTGLAIKTNGRLYAWGRGTFGVRGDSNTSIIRSPVAIGTESWANVSVLSASSTVAVRTDGTLWGWGRNVTGDLGLDNTVQYSSPVQVGALTGWLTAYGRINSVVAIKTNGTLWAWGYNNPGTLGLNDTANRSSPVQVGALDSWTKAVAANHSLAIKTT
jgi:alpha-tubulin suppressor-like RCC1 family protein